jgi:hypothetical protein
VVVQELALVAQVGVLVLMRLVVVEQLDTLLVAVVVEPHLLLETVQLVVVLEVRALFMFFVDGRLKEINNG